MTKASAPLIRSDNIVWVLVAQAFTLVPLLWHLPLWLWGIWLLALGWRGWIQYQPAIEPSIVTKVLLAIGCLLGLYVSFPSHTGLESMIGLLVCSFVLKVLEFKTRKDGLLLIFIGFIAASALFLFEQSLLIGLYGIVSCTVLLTAWQTIFYTKKHSTPIKLKRGILMLVQSLPVMLVLFVVMPRLGPLWSVPVPEARGKTGFTDSMSPGDLGSLVKNGDPAFRVSFAGPKPPSSSLYWRGLILDNYDGRTWRAHNTGLPAVDPAPTVRENLIEYSVIMEPHNETWLFSLPLAIKVDSGANRISLRSDGLVQSRHPVFSRVQYHVTSALQLGYAPVQQLPPLAIRDNSQLPAGGNPKTRELARQWRLAGLDANQKVTQALRLFNEAFTYTLQPPVLGADAVDDFLFVTKSGFCEHFASSFAFLMRAAGVPARVIVGYQGGRFNELENYLLVSQSDAHAWVEVWYDGKGWLTVDPTAAVAPQRIQEGVDQALTEDDRNLIGQNAWQGGSAWLGWQKRWDAVGYAWQRWVLNYDTEKQQGLLTRLLGSTDIWRLLGALLSFAAVLTAFFVWWLLRNRRPEKVGAEARLLAPLLRRLARQGFQPVPGETFSQFLERVGELDNRYRIPAKQLKQLFERVAYGGEYHLGVRLRKHVNAFPGLPRQ